MIKPQASCVQFEMLNTYYYFLINLTNIIMTFNSPILKHNNNFCFIRLSVDILMAITIAYLTQCVFLFV